MRHPQPRSQPALPPCPYCGRPCWAPLPRHPDEHMRATILANLKGRSLLSTCDDGQWNDYSASAGFCYGAILTLIEAYAKDQAKRAAADCGIPAGEADTAVMRVPGGSATGFRRGEEVWLVIDRDEGKGSRAE